ncbi:hypothetical protein BpHYR1_016629 [Brachionus plicatilis]|uniref:Uncharacterized protein n=1 Tax=Brachionus plicatilis TaxID=10195 RepID=A0A3M7PDK8_BRAPC|nr:hypothetical protein BpHYR1_016629 [Brachionus plicatilis]
MEAEVRFTLHVLFIFLSVKKIEIKTPISIFLSTYNYLNIWLFSHAGSQKIEQNTKLDAFNLVSRAFLSTSSVSDSLDRLQWIQINIEFIVQYLIKILESINIYYKLYH